MLLIMDVLIIGAGITGLACARRLVTRGHTVTLVDKGRGPGGRLATRRLGGSPFDTGAQFITARDAGFAAELAAAGADVWCDGFPELQRATPVDGFPRWRMPGGMNQLAKRLAQGLDLRDQRTVTGLHVVDGRWQVTALAGDLVKPGAVSSGPGETLTADAVVVTAPAPQAVALLAAHGFTVPANVQAARYAPCLCLLIDLPDAPAAVLPAPGGIKVVDDPVIGWLSSQRAKGLRVTGDGLVVHATAAWSAANYALDDEHLRIALTQAAHAVLQRLGITVAPSAVELKKWRYSLPTITVPEPYVRITAPLPLLLAGDAFGDRPRVEGAWLSGIAASEALR